MLSRVLNPLLQNHILARVVDFFIAGHIWWVVAFTAIFEKHLIQFPYEQLYGF